MALIHPLRESPKKQTHYGLKGKKREYNYAIRVRLTGGVNLTRGSHFIVRDQDSRWNSKLRLESTSTLTVLMNPKKFEFKLYTESRDFILQ